MTKMKGTQNFKGSIIIDDEEFQKKLAEYGNVVATTNRQQAVHDVATEILRLSSFEVPHDKGMLQNSGFVRDEEDESIVGYNKVYAARLHEHPEYHFQNGRKGKFLEDPIKRNINTFVKYFNKMIQV